MASRAVATGMQRSGRIITSAAVIMIAVLLSRTRATPDAMTRGLEDKHLAMVRDLNAGLNSLGDRLAARRDSKGRRGGDLVTW